MKQAMKIVGKQYVLGETIEEALKVSEAKVARGYSYSYDMLGEAAMTMDDAEYYYSQYLHAIHELAKYATNTEIKKIQEFLSNYLLYIHAMRLQSTKEFIQNYIQNCLSLRN